MAARRPCKKCGRNRAERFFTSARGHTCSTCRKKRTQHASREVRLWETHYITIEEYEAIDAAQHGRCYICERKPRYNKDVDHDHQIERVLLDYGDSPAVAHRKSIRGLLCKVCNRRLLPAAGDDVFRLDRAIEYLETWPATAVLGAALHTNVDFVELMR